MIQRVQTLFLLAIAALSLILFFFPFAQINIGDSKYLLTLMPGCLKAMVNQFIYVPIALNGIVILLSLYTISKYKRRKKQMKFAQLLMLLSAFLMGSLFTMNFIKPGEIAPVMDFKAVSFIPAINIALAFLARWFIKKDDDLVRSADRIR
jgi:uncharacterized membrane protein YuzA (DUF378 family)